MTTYLHSVGVHARMLTSPWLLFGLPFALLACAKDAVEARGPASTESAEANPSTAPAGAGPGTPAPEPIVETVTDPPETSAHGSTASPILPVPPGSWTVEVPSRESGCVTRTVRCQSARLTVDAKGRAPGPTAGCPRAITVECVCIPGAPCVDPPLGCEAPLDPDVTGTQRVQRSSIVDACCFSLPQRC